MKYESGWRCALEVVLVSCAEKKWIDVEYIEVYEAVVVEYDE
jgi:hypothetical protein